MAAELIAGPTERVTESDGAAVHVEPVAVDVKISLPGQWNAGEYLVDLIEVDVVG